MVSLAENKVGRIYKSIEVSASRIFQAGRLLDSEGGIATVAAAKQLQKS
jgi:hypothetical protein